MNDSISDYKFRHLHRNHANTPNQQTPPYNHGNSAVINAAALPVAPVVTNWDLLQW